MGVGLVANSGLHGIAVDGRNLHCSRSFMALKKKGGFHWADLRTPAVAPSTSPVDFHSGPLYFFRIRLLGLGVLGGEHGRDRRCTWRDDDVMKFFHGVGVGGMFKWERPAGIRSRHPDG